MDELISREAVKEMMKNHRVDFSTEKDYRAARACANAVPPAEPERKSCKTCHLWEDGELNIACPWGSNYEHYEDDYCSLWEKQN